MFPHSGKVNDNSSCVSTSGRGGPAVGSELDDTKIAGSLTPGVVVGADDV